MMKRWICLVIAALFLSACGNSVDGTYYNVANQSEYIELKNDGNFYLKAGNLDFSGKYVVNGKTIILNPDSNMAAKGKIDNGVIVDNDGTRWKKK